MRGGAGGRGQLKRGLVGGVVRGWLRGVCGGGWGGVSCREPGEKGSKEGEEKQDGVPWGTASLSLRAPRAHTGTSPFPEPRSAVALAEMSSRCARPPSPAEGSAGSCASQRGVSSWPEPISQMGEGRVFFVFFFLLRLRSFSQPKFLGLFSPKVSGGQTTMPAPFPPHCPLTPDHPTPLRHGIISELMAFQGIGAAPRHPIPLRPSLPDPGS